MFYRVWHVWEDKIGKHTYHEEVGSVKLGYLLIEARAATQVDADNIMWNAFGLEEWVQDEWEEWYSPDGDDLDDYAEKMGW